MPSMQNHLYKFMTEIWDGFLGRHNLGNKIAWNDFIIAVNLTLFALKYEGLKKALGCSVLQDL